VYEAFTIPLDLLSEISKHGCFTPSTLILFLCFSTKATSFLAYLSLYKNFPRNSQKEICFRLKFLNSGMIMQTTRQNLFNLQAAA